MEQVKILIQCSYFITALLFILGLKRMSSPANAKSGIVWAGCAMLLASIVTLFTPGLSNYGLILLAIALGVIPSWIASKKIPMTDMPQMIALFNGMGGGAAGAIACLEMTRPALLSSEPLLLALSMLGALIGNIAFSGSFIAFLKLQGWMREKPITFPLQKTFNLILFLATLFAAVQYFITHDMLYLWLFFGFSLSFGKFMTLPIGGGDMPVVISLFNAFTGLAVGFEGFALGNYSMIIAGTVVGAAGTLLTQLMAKAMNRSIRNVLFGAFGKTQEGSSNDIKGSLKEIALEDAAILLAYSSKVIIVPGYGMAVAQAQHKVRELLDLLQAKGIEVKFAIHPVAGRMPGHMNVLLAESGVPYETLFDIEEINAEFPSTDVSLVIGANDVVNPAARNNASSPIYGMPILDVDKSKNAIVVKRGKGKGFAGIENELFYGDNTRMLYGDAQTVINELVQALKRL